MTFIDQLSIFRVNPEPHYKKLTVDKPTSCETPNGIGMKLF
jgi:hypothetical protein